ncbi:hypothetical protein M752DRAFT_27853 [Aspergillus phoenicis ATCC 13157]|uniref:Uncharacterized protein n=1 Tax=Aspergillus phoenicis ATCC 13157 TaxID=1353007 RepID=A0A370PH43_ASPPH|nr:hypothetical protein M752DRAFT_27853 [Aspergillus phoenicis ATCC 13157]
MLAMYLDILIICPVQLFRPSDLFTGLRCLLSWLVIGTKHSSRCLGTDASTLLGIAKLTSTDTV